MPTTQATADACRLPWARVAPLAKDGLSQLNRLNDGLVAVAIVLAILTGALSTIRGIEIGAPYGAEWPVVEVMN